MSPGRRGALSVALGLAVALALLPTALDDDTDARSPAGDAVAHDGTRSAGSGTTTTAPPTVETSSTTSSTTTTSTTSPTTTSTSTTTTTTTTTVAASGSGSAPRAGASATSRVELDVTSVGDPVSGADTTLTTTIAATRAGPGAVTVTIDLEGAVAIHAPNGCTHAETTITCSTALGAGDLVEFPVLVAVDPAATTITVGARAAVANGVDPSPVTASFPTVAAGPGLSARLTAVGNLDITLVGNTLASCGAGTGIGAVTCESVRAGGALTALVNDTWPMTVVGADDRSTGSSSSAEVVLDAGSEVVRAYLVWAASTTSTTPGGAGSIRLATPATTATPVPGGDADYVDVTADDTFEQPGAWQSIAEVTDLVVAGGGGGYWVADIAADLGGTDSWAGWALVVVHTGDLSRHIVILDGLVDLRSTALETPIPGVDGTVVPHVGVVLWDGDAGSTGEQLALAGQVLANSTNPVDDVANSTISRSGVVVTNGRPAHRNTLGVDVDLIDLAPVTGPGLHLTAASPGGDDALLGLTVIALDR